jgi:hypothetical protein
MMTALAVGMLAVGTAAPARADGGITVVNQHWYDVYGAGCLTQTCYVSWVDLYMFSHPWQGDCAGSQGHYTACTVEFSCQTSGWGLTGNAPDCSRLRRLGHRSVRHVRELAHQPVSDRRVDAGDLRTAERRLADGPEAVRSGAHRP